MYYLIYIWIAVKILQFDRGYKFRLFAASLLLVLNLGDQMPLYTSTAEHFRTKPNNPVYDAVKANGVLKNYAEIKLFPVFDLQEDRSTVFHSEEVWRSTNLWLEVLVVASELGLSTNFAYQSRPVGGAIKEENILMQHHLDLGIIAPGQLYVFPTLEEQLLNREAFSNDIQVFSIGSLYFIGRRIR
jgi:hypothetical protein